MLGLAFLLKERCCWGGPARHGWEKCDSTLLGEIGILTAARLVVEPGGHEEALLGRGRRQGPLVGRKDGDHQWRELALDLLMREAGERGVTGGGGRNEERKGEPFLKPPRQTCTSNSVHTHE